jgi:sigma-E factor negative regulatory protein RseC
MINETGRIVAIESDCVWVETLRKSTCNSCSAQKGCGHGLLNKFDPSRAHHVRVLLGDLSPDELSVGDQVEMGIPEQLLVGGALLAYLMPLVTMLFGTIVVSYFWEGDIAAFIGALSGVIVGFGLLKLHAVKNHNNPSLQPKLQSLKDPVLHSLTL